MEQVKTNQRCAANTGSWKDNMRFPIWIPSHGPGRATRCLLGRRWRRRLAARTIPLGNLTATQTAAWAVYSLSKAGHGRKDANYKYVGPRNPRPPDSSLLLWIAN